LRFDYSERIVMLDPLGPGNEPGEYDLCLHHAARSTPPTGWTLRDRAPAPETAPEPAPPAGLDRGQGVARLAAALSAVPGDVSEDALDAAPVETGRPAAAQGRTSRSGRLDGLLGNRAAGADRAPAERAVAAAPTVPASASVRPVPLSERTPEVAVRPVPQPLRLAPDPTTTVWCADLLGSPETVAPDAERPAARHEADEVPTLFA
jgi:hypothetical protein